MKFVQHLFVTCDNVLVMLPETSGTLHPGRLASKCIHHLPLRRIVTYSALQFTMVTELTHYHKSLIDVE